MSQLLSGIVLALLVLAGVAVLPAIWRGPSPFLDEGSAALGWFWGERARRGLVRGIVAADIACGGLALALIAIGVAGGSVGAVAWLGAATALGGLLLLASIVLVNQPTFLVPPALRRETGALVTGPQGRQRSHRGR